MNKAQTAGVQNKSLCTGQEGGVADWGETPERNIHDNIHTTINIIIRMESHETQGYI